MSQEYKVTKADIDTYERRVQEYLAKPLTEETANQWNYGLNVLPPHSWTSWQGMEVFMVGECVIDDVYTQHASVKNVAYPGGVRYFTKNVRARDRDTWISEEEVNRYTTGRDGHTRHKTSEKIILDVLSDDRRVTDELEDMAEKIATALAMASKFKDTL